MAYTPQNIAPLSVDIDHGSSTRPKLWTYQEQSDTLPTATSNSFFSNSDEHKAQYPSKPFVIGDVIIANHADAAAGSGQRKYQVSAVSGNTVTVVIL